MWVIPGWLIRLCFHGEEPWYNTHGFYTPKYRGYFNRETYLKTCWCFLGVPFSANRYAYMAVDWIYLDFYPEQRTVPRLNMTNVVGQWESMGAEWYYSVFAPYLDLFGIIMAIDKFNRPSFPLFFDVFWDRLGPLGLPLLLDAESKNLFVHSSHFGMETIQNGGNILPYMLLKKNKQPLAITSGKWKVDNSPFIDILIYCRIL